jgi:peroxiredoxin
VKPSQQVIPLRRLAVFALAVVSASFSACGGARATTSPAPAEEAISPVASSEASIAVTPEMGTPHAGDAAPDFELADQRGEKVRLSELRGSVVVLAFVTSWCPFSQAEQPYLARLSEAYRVQNVKVLAVDIKENDDGYGKYMGRVAMPFPVLRDRTGEVVGAYTPDRAQPDVMDRARVLVTSNLVIDSDGRIRFFTMVDTARFDAELVHVRRAVDRLLAKGGRG